jgi:hypothetical protein
VFARPFALFIPRRLPIAVLVAGLLLLGSGAAAFAATTITTVRVGGGPDGVALNAGTQGA